MKNSALSFPSGNVGGNPTAVPGRAGDDAAGPARAGLDAALHDLLLRQPPLEDAQVRVGVGGRHGGGQESSKLLQSSSSAFEYQDDDHQHQAMDEDSGPLSNIRDRIDDEMPLTNSISIAAHCQE